MNIENIKALSEILNNAGLTSLEVCDGDTKIKLEKNMAFQKSEPKVVKQPVYEEPEVSETPVNFNNLTEIKSPLVGVFYLSPSPESDPFVGIGSKVKKGDVLCIIEAMKLMNEITAEADGEIVDICVKNGDIAEFGQTLFKMF